MKIIDPADCDFRAAGSCLDNRIVAVAFSQDTVAGQQRRPDPPAQRRAAAIEHR